jgi:putative endonuclease
LEQLDIITQLLDVIPACAGMTPRHLCSSVTPAEASTQPERSDITIFLYIHLMIAKGGYVYIVTNKYRTTLYIGVTSNLYARITEHKSVEGSVFTGKYNCKDLIYWEFHEGIEIAIEREKQLKKWKRAWKDRIIKEFNPTWRDLYDEVEDMV